MTNQPMQLKRARESRANIEKLYIAMRHLFNRGFYKPSGVTGREVRQALLTLNPEIYGSINNEERVELDGLIYVMDRLPKGIESCQFIKIISEEGYRDSNFENIVPLARRRNCYRIDKEMMIIEITRGRSEIYDLMTHLTFLFNEAGKIRNHALTEKNKESKEWLKLEEIVHDHIELNEENIEIAITYLSKLLGQSFSDTKRIYQRLAKNPSKNNGLFQIVYGLGKLSIDEFLENKDREINFTPRLRDRIGHHIYGEKWANTIKQFLIDNKFSERPIHIISANLHSVMNSLYAYPSLKEYFGKSVKIDKMALELSSAKNAYLVDKVKKYGQDHGMYTINDTSGTNISVQIYDTTKLEVSKFSPELKVKADLIKKQKPLILVMDYAFGEQAFETMDELLKPYEMDEENEYTMNVHSISIMGKAGILYGGKGDLMIPSAHVFEGTADNYPFENSLTVEDFKGYGLNVYQGPMISVLGTSLQNRDILNYFKKSSWKAIGLEMEGAHYQKAIQAASKIRKNLNPNVITRYAYYASDNPIVTGSTLASGNLGEVGVRPTYLITIKILNQILNQETDDN